MEAVRGHSELTDVRPAVTSFKASTFAPVVICCPLPLPTRWNVPISTSGIALLDRRQDVVTSDIEADGRISNYRYCSRHHPKRPPEPTGAVKTKSSLVLTRDDFNSAKISCAAV